jgi:hypothetical protein
VSGYVLADFFTKSSGHSGDVADLHQFLKKKQMRHISSFAIPDGNANWDFLGT